MPARHLPRSTWLSRLRRGRRFDRNPLRRWSDRAETVLVGVLLAAFVAGVPLVAHVAGSLTYAASAREARAQRAVDYQVSATLLQSAQPWGAGEYGAEAEARWKAPDGQVTTGEVPVPSGGPAGSTVTIWVNHAGQPIGSPLQPSQVAGRADLAQALAVAALAIALIVVGRGARWALDRRRLAAWDADWLATGPRWSSRR